MKIEWKDLKYTIAHTLSDLIKINTTNPPGNETQAAIFVQEILKKEGIDSQIYESEPGRGSIVARIEGSGTGKPIILLSHLDVVEASPELWECDPFSGKIDDEFVWGRGALDMKGMLVMELFAMILIKRSGMIPEREIILVSVADEEAGGVGGIEWLLKQNINGLDEAEYVLNEGGFGKVENGIPIYSCQNAEKGVLWLKMHCEGTAGHASMPSKDNAIVRINEAVIKLIKSENEIKLCETTRNYLKRLADIKNIRIDIDDQEATDSSIKSFANTYLKDERSVQAMLYNTISPTTIKAGKKINVLPESCEITLDCRLLPGETPHQYLEKVKNMIDDPKIKMEMLTSTVPTESSINTELYHIIEAVITEEMPCAVVAPLLFQASTDSRCFRKKNITSYGFIPILISEEELQSLHGVNERISLENLEQGTRILYEVISRVSNAKR